MTEKLDIISNRIDKLDATIRNFKTVFNAFEPGFIELVDDQSRMAIGKMMRRKDYEIYELDIEKGFCAIQHSHNKAYELHLIINGYVNIKEGESDNLLVSGQSLKIDKGVTHTFIALDDTKIITVAVPTLNEINGDKGQGD